MEIYRNCIFDGTRIVGAQGLCLGKLLRIVTSTHVRTRDAVWLKAPAQLL